MGSSRDSAIDDECPNGGSIWERTGCILGYAGSGKDIAINYVVLSINLFYCAAVVLQKSKCQRGSDKSKKIQQFALASLAFVTVFQILLCLALGCAGISIIWCAMGGWIMSERRRTIESASPTGEGSTRYLSCIAIDLVALTPCH